MLHKIGELPAHPLLVHLPLVLGPLVGVLALGLLNPSWRTKLIKPLAALSLVTSISAILAAESGEWLLANLNEVNPAIEEHEEAAEMFRNLSILLTIGLIGGAVFMTRLKGVVQTAAVVVLAVLGLATVGSVIETGHEGATAVWEGELSDAPASEPGDDGN